MPDRLKKIPVPSIRRLPSYLRFLYTLKGKGREAVSCTHIAEDLSLDPTQVRKDLALTGITGKPKVGYSVGELILAIEKFLGWHNTTDAFLVGAGNLGKALLNYPDFKRHGLNIVAAFDSAPGLVGSVIQGKEVFDLERLPELAERLHVQIGVVTVPAEHAQSVATLLVMSGIKAIWNFAPTRLEVPESIIVEDVHLTTSLAVLSSRLEASKNENAQI